MRCRFILFYFLLLLYSCSEEKGEVENFSKNSFTFSSEKKSSLEIQIPQNEISTGDRFTIDLILIYNSDYIPIVPQIELWDIPFNIIDINDSVESSTIKITRVYTILVEAVLPGDFYLNQLTVKFYKDDNLTDSIDSDFIPVKINSSLKDGNSDLIDNSELIPIDQTFPIIFPIVIIFILLIVIILLILNFRKNKIKPDQISIKDTYSNKIDQIHKYFLKDEKNYLEFYIKLSALIKEYLDLKLKLKSSSQTTEEFIENYVNSTKIDNWYKYHLFNFLTDADKIKFSAKIPDKKMCENDYIFCRRIMEAVDEL